MMRAIGLAALLVLTTAPGAAQDRAVRLGEAAAQRLCADCHAVRRGELRSPFSGAPAFPVIAMVPGMTAAALRVALHTSHRIMPDIMLGPDERDDVVAYILSLQTPRE